MLHRQIGSLSVSVVGLGCNQLGTAACDETVAKRVVREALDAGITFFDTSDEYGHDYADPTNISGWGRSEEILGGTLQSHRDKVVIATKFGPIGPLGNPMVGDLFHGERSEAGAKGVRIAIEESLSRLRTDRIDLYQLHFPDHRFPIEETLSAVNELVREGKVREIGVCNFNAEQLRVADEAAGAQGMRRFATDQGELNILRRSALADIMPMCEALRLRFIPYYPLASGVLTGKYRRGADLPAGSRMSDQVDPATRARILSDRLFARLEALERYAADHGRSILELAFAWLLGLPAVPTVIAGAARSGQAFANAHAGDWVLTPEQVAEVIGIASETG